MRDQKLSNDENLEKTCRNLEKQDWSEMRVFGMREHEAIKREIEGNEVRIA